ncbi:hypothetical protein [Pseudomonas sp. zfem005]|uniref:hypothetical protein n=1 Tax=Pseudomonas sp. zfem005 TaxID=3078200 RepID=UPI002929FC28|nr:hypothetical protein [Pseudomonas sp. zfem005]MDU9414290.1 hypothetical protein [Pseudomonas sp. zfem005]
MFDKPQANARPVALLQWNDAPDQPARDASGVQRWAESEAGYLLPQLLFHMECVAPAQPLNHTPFI